MKMLLNELLQRKVGDLGEAKRAIHCAPDLSIHAAISTMKNAHIGSLVVVQGLKVVGIFTERDFLERVALNNVVITTSKVGEFMTPSPVCVQRHENLGLVLNKMREGGFRHIIIVDSYGNLEKVVSLREIMDYLVHCLAQAA